jgi:hypothetical protein
VDARDELVACPGCDGKRKNCRFCEGGGLIPLWAAQAITTDGEVR